MEHVFQEWIAPWSRLGFWLCLWDEAGRHIAAGGAGAAFWESLLHHSDPFHHRLRQLAQDAQHSGRLISRVDDHGGVAIVSVPLLHRRHSHGAVLACTATPGLLDEEAFARFCSQYQLDRTLFVRLAAGLPTVERHQFEALSDLFGRQMRSLHIHMLTRSEVSDLTAHLAQTYEELNLIYRISSGLRALGGPAHHLEHVCRELVAATPIESMAAVLEPGKGSSAGPTILRAGPVKADDDEILRLCQYAREAKPDDKRARVFNQIGGVPQLAWAAGWLRQFAFHELSRDHRIFGGILAINRADGQDLGSYEIQLLNAVADRSTAFLETLWLYDDLEHLFGGMLHALVNSIDAKDPYTCGHSQRVAWLSRQLAVLAGLPEEKCQRVYLAGLLHDVGKIGISEAVLRKTGRLTRREFEEMKRHPAIGARILQNVPHVEDIIPGVLYHHERLDGRGYPEGLHGDQVPFLARAIGLADSFDAMTTNRTYRPAQMIEVAAAEVRRCAGAQFDPALAELLLSQDLHTLHARMTEFGAQPVRAQTTSGLTGIMGARL